MNSAFSRNSIVILAAGFLFSCAADGGDELPPPVVQTDHLETFRPQFHFTPLSGWMNDPNGLVRVGDTWNLYHQYIPGEFVIDRMDWGHATSPDLLHWTYAPTAIFTNPDLGLAYSGSAIVDETDASGLCGDDPMQCVLAFFTHSLMLGGDQKQSLAVSHDGGMTFTEYDGNPIMPNPGMTNFRDPKVFQYDASLDARAEGPGPAKWVMALAQGSQIGLHTSADLLEWQPMSTIDNPDTWMGPWECPDLIRMAVANEPGRYRWVMLASAFDGAPWDGSGVQYIVGDFDGYTFTPDDDLQEQHWLDHGWDFYAAQTFSGVPADDGRTIVMAWMNNWKYALGIPAMPWQGAMAFPRQLSLSRRQDGTYEVLQAPVDELESLRRGTVVDIEGLAPERLTYQDTGLPSEWMHAHVYSSDTGLYEIDVTGPRRGDWKVTIGSTAAAPPAVSAAMQPRAGVAPGLVASVDVGVQNGWLILDRGNAICDGCPAAMGKYYTTELAAPDDLAAAGLAADRVTMKILVDHSSVEVFADGGRTTMTALTFLPGPGWSVAIDGYDETLDNDLFIDHLVIRELFSTWGTGNQSR